jgi:hypothetical protein
LPRACTLAHLYFALTGRWWAACLLAGVAMMARIPGAALAPGRALAAPDVPGQQLV